MRSKRYRRTEEAILEVLFCEKQLPNVKILTKKAQISRSTLYRHHKTVPGIIPDYEKEILTKYNGFLQRLNRKKRIEMKDVYLGTLFFMVKNKRMLKILLKYEGGIVIEKMIMRLKKRLIIANYLPKDSDRLLKVYIKEVTGIIEEWAEENFAEGKLEMVLKDIMYLTRTLCQRLKPLKG